MRTNYRKGKEFKDLKVFMGHFTPFSVSHIAQRRMGRYLT